MPGASSIPHISRFQKESVFPITVSANGRVNWNASLS